ncbi:unnamed protein product [Bursaphelenchus okinawaensis]|uniref:Uncharacterized protein n=1 Tax=Bursaphelenchus okinawaensis TaxID=465554 RepID=A0A811JVW1_9BILA|nr:unnamed protein product [Bursaphelenchus okinawaensis]CAG9085481.1 unnamed protein product [Bursaphelenchus okinawaensis]
MSWLYRSFADYLGHPDDYIGVTGFIHNIMIIAYIACLITYVASIKRLQKDRKLDEIIEKKSQNTEIYFEMFAKQLNS